MRLLVLFFIFFSFTACTQTKPLSQAELDQVTALFTTKLTEVLTTKVGFKVIHSLNVTEVNQKDGVVEMKYSLDYSTEDETSGEVQNTMEATVTLKKEFNWKFWKNEANWTATMITPNSQEYFFNTPVEIAVEK